MKKGFELSINFLVIMILMIVVLGFGITIFSALFDKGQEFKEQVDSSTQRRMNQLLNNGDPVTLLQENAELSVGEEKTFHLGIRNELKENDENDFYVNIKLDDPPPQPVFEVIAPDGPFTIERRENKVIPFKIIPQSGTQRGSYTFTVEVCTNTGSGDIPDCSITDSPGNKRYYLPQKIYINVR